MALIYLIPACGILYGGVISVFHANKSFSNNFLCTLTLLTLLTCASFRCTFLSWKMKIKLIWRLLLLFIAKRAIYPAKHLYFFGRKDYLSVKHTGFCWFQKRLWFVPECCIILASAEILVTNLFPNPLRRHVGLSGGRQPETVVPGDTLWDTVSPGSPGTVCPTSTFPIVHGTCPCR